MKIEHIDTRSIDHGVGVLRGMLSRPDLKPLAPGEIELAITHIRGAARLVERLQRQIWKTRSTGQRRRRRR